MVDQKCQVKYDLSTAEETLNRPFRLPYSFAGLSILFIINLGMLSVLFTMVTIHIFRIIRLITKYKARVIVNVS